MAVLWIQQALSSNLTITGDRLKVKALSFVTRDGSVQSGPVPVPKDRSFGLDWTGPVH